MLIATIDERVLNLKWIIGATEQNIHYVISHQISSAVLSTEAGEYVESLRKRNDVFYRMLKGQGVARNRNNTLSSLKPGELCLILDDDVRLCENAYETVIKTFEAHPSADVISFKILDFEGKDFKRYATAEQRHTLKSLAGIGTTEMAFRSDAVLRTGVSFDERFGPGAPDYPVGEDYIFAMDLYRRKTAMLFVPIPIVSHPSGSTGGSPDAKVVFGRGAVFARVFGPAALLADLYFALKKRSLYREHYTFWRYLRLMLGGSFDYWRRGS